MLPELHISVLLVEDNEGHYVLTRAQLEGSKFITYDLDWALDYQTALQMIAQKSYDVCVLDYDLGRLTGLDFVQEDIVKKSEIPIIFLTGRGNDEVDFEAMQRGVIDYIDKTQMNASTLDRALRYAVQRSRNTQAEKDQSTFLKALIDIINAANSTLDFDAVITHILDNIALVIPYDTVDFMLVEDDYTRVTHCVNYGSEALKKDILASRFKVSQTSTFQKMQQTQKPLLIASVHDFEDWIDIPQQEIQSYLGTPIFSTGDLVGFINLTSTQAGFFTEQHSERLWILAQQTAFAVQNAREYEHAQDLAITEERNRLARELHDAVSQTLFSASIVAESLPILLEQDPDEARKGLAHLSRLTKHALSEMRSLLIELRPTAIIEERLDTLILQLATSILTPMNINFSFTVEGEERILPNDIQIAFYRIAGESLNNIQKHARAKNVTINLKCDSNDVRLVIADDGQGFDLGKKSASRFGITFMNERAEKAGIDFKIESVFHHGTTVRATWLTY